MAKKETKIKKRYSLLWYNLYKKTNRMSFLLLFYKHYWLHHTNEFYQKYWFSRKLYGLRN